MMLCAWKTWFECRRVLAGSAQGLPIDPPAYHSNDWSISYHRKELIKWVNEIFSWLDVGHNHWVIPSGYWQPLPIACCKVQGLPFDAFAYHSNKCFCGPSEDWIKFPLKPWRPLPKGFLAFADHSTLSLLFQLLKRSMKNQNVSTIFSRQNNHWTLLALFNNSASFNWLKHNGVVCLPGTRHHPPLTQYDNGTWQKEIIYF